MGTESVGPGRNEQAKGDEPPARSKVPAPGPASSFAQIGSIIAAALLLLGALAGLGWLSWRSTWQAAERELARGAEAGAAAALRIIEGQRLAADVVNETLRGLSDEQVRLREAELHGRIQGLIRGLPLVQTAVVLDRGGRMLVAANAYPINRNLDYASREWFPVLSAPNPPALYISAVAMGRIDGNLFFGLTRRRTGAANGRPPEAFDGAVSVSVSPNALAEAFTELIGETTDIVSMVRFDGQVLMRTPRVAEPLPTIPPGSVLRDAAAREEPRGIYIAATLLPGPDGVKAGRLIAYRRVAGLPLYVAVARPTSDIAAAWRAAVARTLAIGVPTALALLGLGWLAWRRSRAADAARQAMLREAGLRAEAEARHEVESRFRGFFESRAIGKAVFDLETGETRLANDRLLEMLGTTRAAFEADGLDWRAATAPECLARDEAAIAEARAQGWWEAYEKDYLRPDGSRLPVRISSAPVPGRPHCLAIVVQDISEQRRTEARLALALNGTSDGIWDWDLERQEVYHSPRFVGMLGYRPEEWSSSYETWARHVHPDDLGPAEEALRRYLAGDALEYAPVYRMRHRDGSWVWILSRARALHDASGRPLRMVGAHTDVTAQKEAEAALTASETALRRLNEGLEARVREEVAAREAAQARLAQAQRMEALGQLAGGIAHDFNNVLQAVQGGARLIESRADDAPRVRRLSLMVSDAAKRGAAVTRRLLTFARRADLQAEPVDAVELLSTMSEIFAHTLGAGIEVRVQLPAAVPAMLADKSQLETVLVNLATNARDAMSGAGTITLSAVADAIPAEGRCIERPARLKPGAYIRLSVSDTGPGMDAVTLARAAEPFFTTKDQGKGTGLGLAMARGFAEQSGGALLIESAPGRGTTVRIWLPSSPDTPIRSAPLPRDGSDAAATRTCVLLVDDEALVRELTAQGLEAAGYAVLSVGSAAEALELLDTREIDILVTDLSMPGMDGLALIREAQRRRPALPAVLLTGFATDVAELAMSGAISGSFSLLRKPVEAQTLAERVAVLLNLADTAQGRPRLPSA
jgi:PAS domain S-box-containing protein